MIMHDFPLFRKYTNNKSYFKINNLLNFEEIKITPNYYSILIIEIKTLPERNFINDMINDYFQSWQEISMQEYEAKKTYCLNNLKNMDL